MKKIAIDMRMLESGGIGTYISQIVPALIDRFSNYHFYLIGDQYDKRMVLLKKNFSNISIIDCVYPIYGIREQIFLPLKIPKEIEILFVPHFNIPLLLAHKCIVTVHDCFHLEFYKQFGIAKKIYLRILFRTIRNFTKKVMTVSNFSRNEMCRFNRMKAGDIVVTPLGVKEASCKINYDKEKYFLFVGNIKPHKNLKLLIDAMKLVIKKINYSLIVVGSSEGFITRDVSISDYQEALREKVSFTDFILDEELFTLYKNATALVLPSLYEGFGLPAIEAKALGCPTILSDIDAFLEVNRDSSVFFRQNCKEDLAREMIRVANDSELRSELINNGLGDVLQYSWRKCQDRVTAVFQSFLNEEDR